MSNRPNALTRLHLETLEDRLTPAAFGNAWPDTNLTLSFADDADINGEKSILVKHLGKQMTESQWQGEILRAFQTWAVHANIDISVVEDKKTPFDAAGPIQGSGEVGDIRIGARTLSSAELAMATPFDLLGTWSGNVIVNTQYDFVPGGGAGRYDLYTVVLQEAGHVLGLDNSDDPNSVMYTQYKGVRTGLDAGDIAAIQALYGPRVVDNYEAANKNNTLATATPIRFVEKVDDFKGSDPTEGVVPYVMTAKISHFGDVDTYSFKTNNKSDDFEVYLRTSGQSLLQANLKLFDSTGRLVRSAAATNPLNGDLVLEVENTLPNRTYYVQVASNSNNQYGLGGYTLSVGKEAKDAIFPKEEAKFFKDEDHTDDQFHKARSLRAIEAHSDARWDYLSRGSILDKTDVDYFKVQTAADTVSTMVATVWAMKAGELNPIIEVYDSQHNRMDVSVISDTSSSYTISVQGVKPNSTYYIKIAGDPRVGETKGHYTVAVDFRAHALSLTEYATGTLTGTNLSDTYTFTITQNRLYYFDLAAGDAKWDNKTTIAMSILDDNGKLISKIWVSPNEIVSLDLLLKAGTYTIKIEAMFKDKKEYRSSISYSLAGMIRNDPMGPVSQNPFAPPPKPITPIVKPTDRPPGSGTDPYQPT